VNAAARASSHDPVTMRPARMVGQRALGISTPYAVVVDVDSKFAAMVGYTYLDGRSLRVLCATCDTPHAHTQILGWLAATTTRRQRGSGSVGWSRSSMPRWRLTVCGIEPVRRRTGTPGQNAPFSA
jgi:hypothetical protein